MSTLNKCSWIAARPYVYSIGPTCLPRQAARMNRRMEPATMLHTLHERLPFKRPE